ncbi:AAA family ATPase [Kineococcus sp. SYSU DK006]|uniref:AAA family ATPase n=1 Tax=Kineococcus sp. SYSU DK006 TaxID=3383127 RepID=UPI003D7CECBA
MLHGRAHELGVLREVVAAAAAGRGAALVVRGGAGIGKSALLAEVERGSGLPVVSAAGSELEGHLPYAGLHQVCHPFVRHLDELPPAPARAVRRVLGIDAGDGTDEPPAAVAAAVLALLRAAAPRGLVCLVDDAHWLDPASAEVLAAAARRVGTVPLALLLAARDAPEAVEGSGGESGNSAGTPAGTAAADDAFARLPHLRLAPLPEDAARRLLQAQVRTPLDAAVRERIVAEAAGNPLALLELPHAADAGPGGRDDLHPPRGGSTSEALSARFAHRAARLPAPARLLLTLAAAEPTGEPALLERAAPRLGLGTAEREQALATGLLTIGERVRFRHPLARSAVYRTAPQSERRSVHAALAAVTDAAGDPDRRAWHLAQAAAGPDEAVAAELERSALRARRRGGFAAEGAFLERAAVLSVDAAARTARLLAAAEAQRAAGVPEAALHLVAVAGNGPLTRAERAAVDALRARSAYDRSRDPAAIGLLLSAAASLAEVDVARAREVLLQAHAAVVFAGRFADAGLAERVARAVRGLPAGTGTSARSSLDGLLQGLLAHRLDGSAGVPPLRRAVDDHLARGTGLLQEGVLWLACSAAQDLWDETAFQVIAERQLAAARAAGAVAVLPVVLSYRALAHVHAGQFAQAQELVDESHRVTDELAAPRMPYVDVTVAAWRGLSGRTERLCAAAEADAVERREGRLLTAVQYARAVLLNGQGRYAEALRSAAPAGELDEQSMRVWIGPELVEAAARAGAPEQARAALQRLERSAAAIEGDWPAGVLHRCRALLSTGAAAEEHHRAALEHLQRTAAAPHLARSHLLFGEWLRREGRRREAHRQLQRAHELLTALGAHAFAARAAGELQVLTGGAPGAGRGPLTARELQVAQLVAAGATTQEVAAQLVISPRTVDAHLRAVFAKLGIGSRRDLREWSAELPGPAGR